MRSTENQADAIRQYAATRGIEIVRTYADAGKSCLKIEGRDALKQLIDDVQSGATDFTMVLVYDASRWGRFQDADESAYYEYICKRAGIAVQYCAEQFENDGSPSRPSSKASCGSGPPGSSKGSLSGICSMPRIPSSMRGRFACPMLRCLRCFTPSPTREVILQYIEKITVHLDRIIIHFVGIDEPVMVNASLVRCSGETRIATASANWPNARHDPSLIKLIVRAHQARKALADPANPSLEAAASSMGCRASTSAACSGSAIWPRTLQSPFSMAANLRTSIASSSHGSTICRSTGPASARCLGSPAPCGTVSCASDLHHSRNASSDRKIRDLRISRIKHPLDARQKRL